MANIDDLKTRLDAVADEILALDCTASAARRKALTDDYKMLKELIALEGEVIEVETHGIV